MIEVAGLYKKYGSYQAVKGVSFSVKKGEIIGFLGPNGAGKSTIMNIITGYLSLTRGSVTVDGFDVAKNPEKAKKRIGYLPELPPLYPDMKVREYLYFIYDLRKVKFPKKAHIDEILRLMELERVQNRLIRNLSKGYKQRVGFAQALVGNPDVLILDEPTVGLDPKQVIAFRELIERLGKTHTVIISSHILSEIQEVCDRIIIINKGRLIADGTLEQLSADLVKGEKITLTAVGEKEKLQKALEGISSVYSVSVTDSKSDSACDFEIIPQEGVDIREAVFDAAVSAGAKVLSLQSTAPSLEQVFLRLTENADNAEALGALNAKVETEEEEENDESDI